MTPSRSGINLDIVKMPTYHHGNLRAALVQAAIELVEEKGAAGLTLRTVGRRLGVSRSASYHHFTRKEDLLAAVATEGFRRLHDRLARAAYSSEASLRRFSLEYVRFAVTHETLFRIMHQPVGGDESALTRAIDEHAELWGVIAGSPHKGMGAWSAMHGLAVLWIGGHLKTRTGGRTVASLVTAALDSLR